jgi:hypothetical protein
MSNVRLKAKAAEHEISLWSIIISSYYAKCMPNEPIYPELQQISKQSSDPENLTSRSP